MMPVKKILTRFNGLQYQQEYLCFAKESFFQPLHVYLFSNEHIIKDVTNRHLFVGYSPLVFAFADPGLPVSIQLVFSHQLLLPNEIFSKKDAIATLDLALIKKQVADGSIVVYYEGISGGHRFLTTFQQFINSVYNKRYNKKPGNVYLHDNLYKQVQIAYAVPRNISLISISNDNLYNLFPTDLHGQVDEEHYIISLRIGGKACEQVQQAGKLVISQVHADAYKTVYRLGKNHMQPLKEKEKFPLSQSSSENFKWPIPEQALSYKELLLQDSFDHGIHRIMLFKIISYRQLNTETATLAHIHNSYATWRYKNQLRGNYLLR